jgi:chemotaxis family two-component system sensor histidine kinase/response regulator PixL
MTNDPNIREQSYQYFLQEAPELLQVIEQELLTLREDYNVNKVHNLMRSTHTLKGAAASVGLETIKTVAHSLEDIFKALFNPDLFIDPEIEALLFEGYECLRIPLNAELTGGNINDTEILDRAATVFAQLQQGLGDCFGEDTHIPSSVELGFDVTQSIFEVGVIQRLDEIAAALASAEPAAIATTLRTQSEVFLGLAESLNLPGFGAIAQATIAAIDTHPEDMITIAETALTDFLAGRVAVLNGDRTQGGEPSLLLQQLSGLSSSTRAESVELNVYEDEPAIDCDRTEPVSEFFNYPSVDVEVYEDMPLQTDLEVPSAIDTGSEVAEFSSQIASQEQLVTEVHFPTPESVTQPEPHFVTNTSDSALSVGELPDENEESTNLLLETIWGGTEEKEQQEQKEKEKERQEGEATATPSERFISSPISVTPINSMSRTVRVNVEHLEHLNYTIGELLTNQNRQSLQNEQLKLSVRTLLARLQQHQQLLSQLQDWSDRQFVDAEQRRLGRWVTNHRQWAMENPLYLTHNPTPQIQNQFDSLELDRYNDAQLLVQSILEDAVQLAEATEAIDLFAKQSDQTLDKQRRLLSSARDGLMEARMLPLAEIFGRFPRVLQQLEVSHNKRVELELRGNEVLVDKEVAQKLYDPLLHLVRNAFDHGIESPTVRKQLGKPQKGLISISASHRGRHLAIEVRDDGQGLNFDRIRQRAIELLFSPERVNTLNEAQLTDLLFEPGFSTAAEVNDLSGRGIGLDVVRAQLQSLQGSVTIESRPGKGTTFTLQIPLNLTLAKLLICKASDRFYALFTDAIVSIIIPQAEQIRAWEGGKVLRWSQGLDNPSTTAASELARFSNKAQTIERLVPIHPLGQVLDYFSSPSPLTFQAQPSFSRKEKARPVILIRCEDTLIGLEVDQLMGEQELVIRPLGSTILPPSYIYGGSILADGRLTLVLDVAALSQYILAQQTDSSIEDDFVSSTAHILSSRPEQRLLPPQNRAALPAPPAVDVTARPSNVVLLVDDSITLRQTLSLTLQKAGYQVLQAKDGYEAIEQLGTHPMIELVICDIEMPRMNGFEFLKYRQQDSTLLDIPVIILTSRSGEKHRVIATELGATAYITKPFLEHQLLETVNEAMKKSNLNAAVISH